MPERLLERFVGSVPGGVWDWGVGGGFGAQLGKHLVDSC